MKFQGINICWDGHASVRFIDNGFTVAVDPYSKVAPEFEADIVLITHEDQGHFDPDKLSEVCVEGTCVVLPDSISADKVSCRDTEFIEEGEKLDIYGVEIEAFPIYNDSHDRGKGFGYRIVMGNSRFYVSGDTGLIEESYNLEGKVDLAFLPIEGNFTMNIEEAVKFAIRMKPEIVVPYHYGEPFFEDVNPQILKSELEERNIKCKIMEK